MVAEAHDSPSADATASAVVDFVPADDMRSTLAALGVDPDDDRFEFSEGQHQGYVWTIRLRRNSATSSASGGTDSVGTDSAGADSTGADSVDAESSTGEEYTQADVGGTEGDLEAAFGEALAALDSVTSDEHDPESVEYRLDGSADAFRAAMRA